MGEGERGEEGGLRRGKRIVCFWKRGLVKKKVCVSGALEEAAPVDGDSVCVCVRWGVKN